MIRIDDKRGVVDVLDDNGQVVQTHSLSSPAGFRIVSRYWIRATWDAKYVYSFSWLGRPVIQLPDDMLRVQELLFQVQPDVVIETGVAHGGSLVFYASILKALGRGRVIGVDIEIRAHNRLAIEQHSTSSYITLIEGNSIAQETLKRVRALIRPGESVMVILDSNHKKQHVLEELRLYGDLVSTGSYILAADGVMELVSGAPRTEPDWSWNNPQAAVREFVKENPKFELVPLRPIGFNEGNTEEWVSYFPGGLLKRVLL